MKSSLLLAAVIGLTGFLWVVSGLVGPFAIDPEKKTAPRKNTQDTSVKSVRVIQSTASPRNREIILTGRTIPFRNVIIRAETTAPVEEIITDKGTPVQQDILLARLAVQEREVNVSEARERLEQRRIEYEAAQSLEQKGFNSKTTLAGARAELEAARRALESAQLELERTKIKTPFEGIVDDRYIEKGDFVRPGDQLYKIVDVDPIKVRAFVSERNIHRLSTGTNVTVRFLDSGTVNGRLTFVSREANPETRTFPIELEIPNPDFRLSAGLTSEISIPGKNLPAHKISPSILTLDEEGRLGVKTVNANNEVVFDPVTIIEDNPGHMWVSGLPQEANIITVGQEFVVPGQKVKPVFQDNESLL